MCPPIPHLTSKLRNSPKKWYLFFTSHLNMIWSTDSSVSHQHLSCVFMNQTGQFFTWISIFVSCRNCSALENDGIHWTWDLNPCTYQFSAVTAGIKISSVLGFFHEKKVYLAKASSSEWLKVLKYIPCVQTALYALPHLDTIFIIRNIHIPLKNVAFASSSHISENTVTFLCILNKKCYRLTIIGW